MKKIILIIIVAVIVGGSGTYYAFNALNKNTVSIKEEQKPNGVKIIEIKEEAKQPIEKEFSSDMTEGEIQDAIHGMSHQKVKADDKWGFIPITTERIQRLITVVNESKDGYRDSEMYLEILNRWSENDFSQADYDHNMIWNLKGGNIGRARVILSAEEEKEFIKEHFDVHEQ